MKLSLTILFFIATLTINAQYKVSSLGFRLGGVSGVTYKYIEDDNKGFEVILGAKEKGMRLTALLQKYKPIATNRIAGMFVFFGAGAHSGYSKHTEESAEQFEDLWQYSYYEKTNFVLGGDFMAGVAYHFESIPVHISLDYKPYFEFFGENTFRLDLWDIGFTLRYAFNR